jgi:signal transduction histidine kinase
MQQRPAGTGLIQPSTLYLLFLLVSLYSCSRQNLHEERRAGILFNQADSLIMAGKADTGKLLLEQSRRLMQPDDILLCKYYLQKIGLYSPDGGMMALYADSALGFFTGEDMIRQYPKEYLLAVLAKGDASLRQKKYSVALRYYNEARQLLRDGNCDDGNLASKMGLIYFSQKKYAQAAASWAENYHRLENCGNQYKPPMLFFLKQGALNNAGFSYEKSGKLDSAVFFYEADVRLIDKAEQDSLIKKEQLNSARIVVFDNLGGLYLRQKKLAAAETYLQQSIAMVHEDADGVRIPPYLKLAELYNLQKKYAAAAEVLQKAKLLLDRYGKENPESEIKWNRLYAEMLIQQNKPAQAYEYLKNHIRLKERYDSSFADLYKLDVEREIEMINQQSLVTRLKHENGIKQLYLAGITLFVLLFLVIIIIARRNLVKTRRNHREEELRNEELQKALTGLEAANKNYIRMMRIMAHDLRNPLSGITALATMVLDANKLSDEDRYMVKLIETTGINSMGMISELLKSGLADENEAVPMQPLDLTGLVHDSVELLRFNAKEKQQQILLDNSNGPVMIHANREKLWRVLNNVIINAVKFSYTGSSIHVSVQTKEDHVLIAVEDDGIGIPENEQAVIFDMFTSSKKAGTAGEQAFGLGLAISKRIIEMHGGNIWFESKTSGGTIFYIALPRIA